MFKKKPIEPPKPFNQVTANEKALRNLSVGDVWFNREKKGHCLVVLKLYDYSLVVAPGDSKGFYAEKASEVRHWWFEAVVRDGLDRYRLDWLYDYQGSREDVVKNWIGAYGGAHSSILKRILQERREGVYNPSGQRLNKSMLDLI